MHLTLSYDLKLQEGADANQRTYIRSMLERFGWKRLGGSVFRYPADGRDADWLNDIAPSLALFRAYTLKQGITIKYMTVDASGATFVDHSDPDLPVGKQPAKGADLPLATPTNNQASEQGLRNFVDAMTDSL